MFFVIQREDDNKGNNDDQYIMITDMYHINTVQYIFCDNVTF